MKKTLLDYCDFINGGAWSENEYTTKGVPVLKVSNMKKDGFVFDNLDFLSVENAKNYSKNLLKAYDVVIATVGSHPNLVESAAGRAAIIPIHLFNYLLNQNAVCIRTKDNNKLNQRFLGYLAKSEHFQNYIQNRGKGAANQMRIPIGEIKSYPANFPLLPTQQKIAKILSAYDDLIENNLKRIKLLEEMAQRTYEEWFVRFKFPGHENVKFDKETGLPEGWKRVKLGEVAKINSQSLKQGFSGEILYIDIAGVSPNRINSKTKFKYSEAPGRAKRVLNHGDIIWSCVRPNRKSHAVIWNPEKNLIASTGFCVITPKSLPTSYLYQYLTTDKYVGYLSNLAGGAAYPAVKPIHFIESEIVIPCNELILKYKAKYGASLEISWNLQIQNQHLKEARDILLPRLMTGMIDVDEIRGRV